MSVNVPELFGSMVFNQKTMKERLPKETFKALKKRSFFIINHVFSPFKMELGLIPYLQTHLLNRLYLAHRC